MTFNKPKFWDKRELNFFSLLLIPFSFITLLAILLKKKILKPIKFKIPIICVGNIYIGGTGKTPTSILIGKELFKHGIKSSIIRKNYKNHEDEYNLIKNNFNHLIKNKERVGGILEAERLKYDVAILDDGLQDYNIKKDFKILCFNYNQMLGNGFVLPAGPLRENLSVVKDVNVVLINGKKNPEFEIRIKNINKNINIFYSYYKPQNIENFRNCRLIAIAGIGNPENFFELLEKNNLRVEKKLIFPDHYMFSKNEIEDIIKNADEKNYKIIMTEKDFFKIKKFNLKKVEYLKVSLEIIEKEKFINKIQKAIC